MFYQIMRSQENDIISATNEIVETQVAAKRYYNYSQRAIKKTTIRVHYTTETTPNLTVTLMNFQKAGFTLTIYEHFI